MPRSSRLVADGLLDRALVGRGRLGGGDRSVRQAHEEVPTRLLAFYLMPNHWHLVLWPEQDGALSRYLHWVTMTHTQRWHAHHHTTGTGPLYQGRFKSFPVQADEHLLTVCRYVERNPLRAGLVKRAEHWRWSSLWHRTQGALPGWLGVWPLPVPDGWLAQVNAAGTEAELAALRRSAARGTPFGEAGWQQRTAERLGLQSTLRRRGRPRKPTPPAQE
jgi:putative transposase